MLAVFLAPPHKTRGAECCLKSGVDKVPCMFMEKQTPVDFSFERSANQPPMCSEFQIIPSTPKFLLILPLKSECSVYYASNVII